MFYQSLFDVLTRLGKSPEPYSFPDGGRALILPYGGRILGLFSPASDQNFFWTHPALASVEAAREFYDSPEWHNSGGDRTWLAPELDLFFPNYPDLGTYFQPRQLDPGSHRVTRCDGEVCLSNRLEVSLARCGSSVELEITKALRAAPNPLRHDPQFSGISDIEYAGYSLRTSLRILAARPDLPPRIGAWNLLQLPHGGELLIPTYRREAPRTWFGEVPSGDLTVCERSVRYRMRASGGQKIGLRAVATPGRAGYAYATEDSSALVVRNCSIHPSGEYGDVAWAEPRELGYCFQACNINNHFGSFSELEYHAPAAGRASDSLVCEDVSDVWAFRGEPKQIRSIAVALLGLEPEW